MSSVYFYFGGSCRVTGCHMGYDAVDVEGPVCVPGRAGSLKADWAALTLIQIITYHPILQRAALDMLCCTGTLSFIRTHSLHH